MKITLHAQLRFQEHQSTTRIMRAREDRLHKACSAFPVFVLQLCRRGCYCKSGVIWFQRERFFHLRSGRGSMTETKIDRCLEPVKGDLLCLVARRGNTMQSGLGVLVTM